MSDHESVDVTGYHERTKHRFEAYARGPETIDWDAQPDPFRRFAGAPLLHLPLAADTLTVPYSALYAGGIPARPIGLDGLAVLLEMSLGLSAWKQYGEARWSLRCNPSSGNLHPTEAYVLASGIDGLEDGVYHYRADKHALELRCRLGDVTTTPALLIGLSSVHWREAWKYGERAYRYCQLDVGHAVATLGYAAATVGWRVAPRYQIGDDALAALLGLDRADDFAGAEAEHPDLLIALHSADDSAPELGPLLERVHIGEWYGHANCLDRQHFYAWPVIDAVAEAAHRPYLMPNARYSNPPLPAPLPSANREAAADIFRRRRSAQAFDGVTAIATDDLFCLLDHLLPRDDVSPWDGIPWRPCVHPILFVHRVDGLASGLYALPRSEEALTALRGALNDKFDWQRVEAAPAHLPLYHLVTAKAERAAAKLSCLQDIAGDSAFAVSMLAEFDAHVVDTPWRYRELHWEAGTLGQVLYLEAESVGLRGTGIGCFFDDAVHELLGLSGRQFQVIYHFTVGGAVHDPRVATLAPYTGRDGA